MVLHAPSKVSEMPSLEPGILENLSEKHRILVLSRCTLQTYKRGQYLCKQGGLHTENFFVSEGLVRTFYVARTGREITLGYWSNGNLIGGPNFFEVCPHIWSAQAVRDSAAYVIKAADFRALTLEVPPIADCVIRALSFKMRWFSLFCQMLGTESAHRRVARLLQILAPIYGVDGPQGTLLRINFTHEEIGDMVGATRPWVCHAFSKLQRAGALKMRQDHRILLNMSALDEFLAESEKTGRRGRRTTRQATPANP